MPSNHILIIFIFFGIMQARSLPYRYNIAEHHFRRRATDGWTRWTQWECTVTCGKGTARRIRSCINLRAGCDGPRLETKPCPEIPCPVGAPPRLINAARKQIEENTKSYQLQKGESVTLNCQGSLSDAIRISYWKAKPYWHHNKEIFDPDGERAAVMDTMNLLIMGVLPKDNGLWYCEVRLSENAPLITAVYTLAVQNDVPDVEMVAGEPLSLPCYGDGLSEFFSSKMVTQWYHNTSLFKEFENSKAEQQPELVIKASDPSDSGIWLCKVLERDIDLKRASKEWATNTVWVKVTPSKSNILSELPILYTANGNSSQTMIIILVVAAMITVAGIYYYFGVRKKSSKDDKKAKKLINVKKGKRPKKHIKKKIKTGDRNEIKYKIETIKKKKVKKAPIASKTTEISSEEETPRTKIKRKSPKKGKSPKRATPKKKTRDIELMGKADITATKSDRGIPPKGVQEKEWPVGKR